jgi:hypothetical protein
MSKKLQIYYNAIFGAVGGLAAWLLLGQVGTQTWNIWLETAFLGAGIGLLIGAAIGLVEGAIIKHSPARAVLGAVVGGMVGLISGMVGLLIGELVFLVVQGGLVARALGFMLFGLCLGLGEGFASRAEFQDATSASSPGAGTVIRTGKRIGYSAVGGTLAGLAGGLLYEVLTQVFLQDSDNAQVVLGGLGLILIGACLGGIIPFSVETIARVAGRGTLQVLNGRKQGLEESVVDAVTLGSYDGCSVYLPGDPGIDGKHTTVFKGRDGFFVRNISQKGFPVHVGMVTLMPGMPDQRLQPGDQIILGQTTVRFTEG